MTRVADWSRRFVWTVPTTGLFGAWLWAIFSSGAYLERQWLSIALALALFGLVVAWLGIYPQRPRPLSATVASIFAGYCIWVCASSLWAASVRHAWLEGARSFVFLLLFCLGLLYLSDQHARKAFRYLLLLTAFVVWAACLVNLWAKDEPSLLFFGNRFAYPTTYPNNSAALFLLPFWPLIWLAAGPEERAPLRGAALGLATGLLSLAFLTQSRGAFWSLGITFVIAFVVFPARLRLFLYLLVPSLLMVYAVPKLNQYWLDGPHSLGSNLAVETLAVLTVAAALVGTVIAFAERWVRVGLRAKALLGGVIMVGVAAAAIYGATVFASNSGGIGSWLSQTWKQFTEQETAEAPDQEAESSSRFFMVSSNGRIDIWRVALAEFREHPLVGVGADNFVFRYDQLRSREQSKPKEPHSLPLQVLAETGIMGGVLAFGGMLLALGGILWPRCSAGWVKVRRSWRELRRKTPTEHDLTQHSDDSRSNSAWEMALLVAVFYWLIHGSVEWLWQMPGVSMGALLLLAAALSSVDARKESWRPRWALKTSTLTYLFRFGLFAVCLALLVSLGLARVSLGLQDSAVTPAASNSEKALDRAESARWLDMTDPGPYLTQVSISRSAARAAAASSAPDRSGAVLDNLALALHASEQAVSVEPADWSLHYQAGAAALNLLAASQSIHSKAGSTSGSAASLSQVYGVDDWTTLAGSQDPAPDPGLAKGSLATTQERQEAARSYRNMTQEELVALATSYLEAARFRNPLSQAVKEALEVTADLLADQEH